MAYARTLKSGDGSKTDFVFSFPYLSKDHVKVYVNGVLETNWTFFADDTVRFNTAPASGAVILILRQTSPNGRLVDYSIASSLNEEDLDTDSLQAFYLAQEAIDASKEPLTVSDVTGQFTARNLQIKDLAAPTDANDAVTKNWAETSMTSALGSAIAARDAAQVAQSAAETAQGIAESAETAAEAAEAAALASEAAALASENAAAASASAASDSENNAASSESAASASETAAQDAQTAAEAARDAAQAAQSVAEAAETKAQQWAEEEEDVEVETGEYSAKHHAIKAAASAVAAATFDPSSYYTTTSVDSLLSGKSDTGHGHSQSDITGLVSDLADKASLTGTETLTNKTLTSPVINTSVTGTALASQTEAEAGTVNNKLMTPERVAQAIAALAQGETDLLNHVPVRPGDTIRFRSDPEVETTDLAHALIVDMTVDGTVRVSFEHRQRSGNTSEAFVRVNGTDVAYYETGSSTYQQRTVDVPVSAGDRLEVLHQNNYFSRYSRMRNVRVSTSPDTLIPPFRIQDNAEPF